MLSINTNLSSIIAQNSMTQSTNALNEAIERMTTGFKINHAKDNAANYSISTNMTTKLGAYNVAEDNVTMGMDLITTAGDTISLMQDKTQRLRTLCLQARNGTYGAQSLAAINTEANAIISEINRIYSTAQYNGVSLFTGGTDSAETAVAEAMVEEPAPVAMFAMARTTEPEMTTFAMTRTTSSSSFIKEIEERDTTSMVTMTQLVGGTTSATNEYSISTKEELVALANYVNSGKSTSGMTFVLGDDIDLSSISNWTPIGVLDPFEGEESFSGTFDGNGHVIKNLTIDNENKDYQGLFGDAMFAEIKNVGIEGGSVKGNSDIGLLVGIARSVTISNCYSTGSVNGSNQVGGLVGVSGLGCTISNCYSDVIVNGDKDIGGLVGIIKYNVSINNCYTTGTVTGNVDVGGFAGFIDEGSSILDSYSTSDVYGNRYSSDNVGGFVGYSYDASYTDCYTTGSVTGNEDVGGFVGCGYSSTYNNCSSTGVVTGSIGSNSYPNNESNGSDPDPTPTPDPDPDPDPPAGGGTDPTPDPDPDPPAGGGTDPTPDPTPTPPTGGGGTIDGGSYNVDNFLLQVGVNSGSTCQIGFDINFSYDLSIVGADIASDEALDSIDNLINQLSAHETMLGAVQNRLESALEEIIVQRDNLVSSRSTLRDADIAKVSSHYIQQQILQQASATLMATANQSPSIALQLI